MLPISYGTTNIVYVVSFFTIIFPTDARPANSKKGKQDRIHPMRDMKDEKNLSFSLVNCPVNSIFCYIFYDHKSFCTICLRTKMKI